MRRILSITLCLCLLLSFTACSVPDIADPANFYYRQTETSYESEDGIIGAEIRDLTGLRDDPETLFSTYFSGPDSNSLESPFPRDTHVVSWSLESGALTLVMNEGFAALSGVDLSIACACISRTFLPLSETHRIVIRAENATLDGSNYIVMSADNLLLADDVMDRLYPTLTLYYTDAQQRYLIGQEISVNLADEADIITHLVNQLIGQPEDPELMSALPATTQLLDVVVNNGVCVLNFSEKFESGHFSGTAAQRLTLLAVVNTLTQLDDIEMVEFCVEGNLLAQYGQLTISGAFTPDETAIGPVRTALSEFDATLYLANGSGGYLAEVPSRIRQTTFVTQAELVLQVLLNYKSSNGFVNTIPAGTTVNSVTFRNSICYVDLSQTFLSSTDHIPTSVRSIVASLCALDSVRGVKITIDGVTPEGDLTPYFGIMRPSSDWYL